MNCPDFEKLALLQDSGELAESQRQALAEHLTLCPACRELRNQMVILRQTVKRESSRLPEGPSATVLETIHQAAVRHHRRNRWALTTPWRGIWAAAASLALCLLGVKLLLGHPQAKSGAITVGHHPGAIEIVPLVAILMDKETVPPQIPGDTDLGVVANQLLILQGMNGDSQDEVAEEISLFEDNLPTTLQWHNSSGFRPEKCG